MNGAATRLDRDGAVHILSACISSSNWTLSERVEARRALAYLLAAIPASPSSSSSDGTTSE